MLATLVLGHGDTGWPRGWDTEGMDKRGGAGGPRRGDRDRHWGQRDRQMDRQESGAVWLAGVPGQERLGGTESGMGGWRDGGWEGGKGGRDGGQRGQRDGGDRGTGRQRDGGDRGTEGWQEGGTEGWGGQKDGGTEGWQEGGMEG